MLNSHCPWAPTVVGSFLPMNPRNQRYPIFTGVRCLFQNELWLQNHTVDYMGLQWLTPIIFGWYHPSFLFGISSGLHYVTLSTPYYIGCPKLFKIPHPKALVMLWRQLGLPVLAGICCMLAMLATQIKISRPPPRRWRKEATPIAFTTYLPSGNYFITMENHHFQWEKPL